MVKVHLLSLFLLLVIAFTMSEGMKDKVAENHEEASVRGHWPHLIGQTASSVEATIKQERPDLHIVQVLYYEGEEAS